MPSLDHLLHVDPDKLSDDAAVQFAAKLREQVKTHSRIFSLDLLFHLGRWSPTTVAYESSRSSRRLDLDILQGLFLPST